MNIIELIQQDNFKTSHVAATNGGEFHGEMCEMENMEYKICSKCKKQKPINEFYKRTETKYYTACKECEYLRTKKYKQNNPDKVNKFISDWREKNRERIREVGRLWEQSNPLKIEEKNKKRKEKIKNSPELKERQKAQHKNWRLKNKEKDKARKEKWNKENSEKIKMQNAEYRKINREKINQLRKEWLNENPIQKVNYAFGRRIREAINNKSINYKWKKEIGYGIKELKNHLEKQFKEGMSWENYGEWHIDHILPVSKFNFKSPKDEDFKRCWALKNLQPLWKEENIKKGNKLNKPLQQSLVFGE